MAGDDDFNLSKYVLELSKKIAQFTKDYVGLPFSNSSQLPFAIESRPQEKPKFFSLSKKWQKGDAVIGLHKSADGQKRMVLNLPDGSTMIDMCYPGWEVSILEPSALDHFFRKRYLFGDYYGHLLNGRPLQHVKNSQPTDSNIRNDVEATMARQEEIFRQRRTSLQEAAEQQQRRGVPFDAHPQGPADVSRQEHYSTSLNYSDEAAAGKKTLTQVTVGTRFVRDASTGVSDNRLVIQKKYNTGEIETIERRAQSQLSGEVDHELDRMLSSHIFKVFPDIASSAPEQDEAQDSNRGQSPESPR